MPKEKEPGIDIEEQKSRLRLEEIEEAAAKCEDCARERKSSGDPTAYCAVHLKHVYGI